MLHSLYFIRLVVLIPAHKCAYHDLKDTLHAMYKWSQAHAEYQCKSCRLLLKSRVYHEIPRRELSKLQKFVCCAHNNPPSVDAYPGLIISFVQSHRSRSGGHHGTDSERFTLSSNAPNLWGAQAVGPSACSGV